MWFMHVILVFLLLRGSVTDLRERVVDNRISYSILIVGLCRMLLEENVLFLAGGIFAFVLMGIPALLGKGIGGADVKISIGIGLYTGLFGIMKILLAAFLLGIAMHFTKRIFRKTKNPSIPLILYLGVSYLLYIAGML